MKKFFNISFLFFMSFVINSPSINVEGRENHRDGKVFSLFNIVKFENAGCETSGSENFSGQNRNGTCYSSSECGDKGGNSKGSCAAGFGVCCVFIYNDGVTKEVTQNNTYIQNKGYPTGDTGTDASITYTVKKCSDDICYLRIDFEQFSINGPANSMEYDEGESWTALIGSGGKCDTASMVVTPPSSTNFAVPTICGENSGEHIYIPMGTESSNTASIAFSYTNDDSKIYDLKLTQIECGDKSAPPEGCLQYYTGTSGKLRTFNFQDSTKTTSHLALQDYQICMRQEEGYCCNLYTVCDESDSDQANSFSLFDSNNAAYDNVASTAIAVSACTQDFITIDGGQSVCSTNPTIGGFSQSIYCGDRFAIIGNDVAANLKANNPVCDCTTPFMVGIHTDNTADDIDPTADLSNAQWSRGVCLDFKQQPC